MEGWGSLFGWFGGNFVGCAFLIELGFLHGRDVLSKYDMFSLIKY